MSTHTFSYVIFSEGEYQYNTSAVKATSLSFKRDGLEISEDTYTYISATNDEKSVAKKLSFYVYLSPKNTQESLTWVMKDEDGTTVDKSSNEFIGYKNPTTATYGGQCWIYLKKNPQEAKTFTLTASTPSVTKTYTIIVNPRIEYLNIEGNDQSLIASYVDNSGSISLDNLLSSLSGEYTTKENATIDTDNSNVTVENGIITLADTTESDTPNIITVLYDDNTSETYIIQANLSASSDEPTLDVTDTDDNDVNDSTIKYESTNEGGIQVNVKTTNTDSTPTYTTSNDEIIKVTDNGDGTINIEKKTDVDTDTDVKITVTLVDEKTSKTITKSFVVTIKATIVEGSVFDGCYAGVIYTNVYIDYEANDGDGGYVIDGELTDDQELSDMGKKPTTYIFNNTNINANADTFTSIDASNNSNAKLNNISETDKKFEIQDEKSSGENADHIKAFALLIPKANGYKSNITLLGSSSPWPYNFDGETTEESTDFNYFANETITYNGVEYYAYYTLKVNENQIIYVNLVKE